jgi:isopenicillin N synthase-like dioxygenase
LEANLQLAQRILTILQAAACPHLSATPTLIADSHTLWGEDGQCTLRYLHYPPIDDPDRLRQLLAPDADGRIHWRAGPHTDWDNITLLYQQEPGLECCANPRVVAATAGESNNNTTTTSTQLWIPVDPVPGAVAVNIGDMLARWSDGRLYSNLHRVRMPRPLSGEEASSSRYSIAFFAIRTPHSDPISAGDYLLSRIQSNFAK